MKRKHLSEYDRQKRAFNWESALETFGLILLVFGLVLVVAAVSIAYIYS